MPIPWPTLDNMVYTGFRDARRDIQDPPPAQVPPSPPDPHDEEDMDARPDQEEMEDAINSIMIYTILTLDIMISDYYELAEYTGAGAIWILLAWTGRGG